MNDYLREDIHEFLEIYHFTPSEFEKVSPAWPIRLGYNEAKPNYHIGPRTTPYYYLLFIVDGEGSFIHNQQTYPLQRHDMFCLLPHVTHEYYSTSEHPLRKIFMAFDGPMAYQLLERIGLTSHTPHVPNVLTPTIISSMFEFKNAIRRANGKPNDLTRLACFLHVFDTLSTHSHHVEIAKDNHESWLQKGREYIDIHYADGINVERVSSYIGVGRTTFTKQFTKCYGITPIQYIQSLKMNEGKKLLEQSTYSLSEIAASLGYPDLFSFSKAFKKKEGISPSRFRASFDISDLNDKKDIP